MAKEVDGFNPGKGYIRIAIVDDKEVVEDLILAAIKDAQQKAAQRAKDEMGKMTEGLGLPPGMNLPF